MSMEAQMSPTNSFDEVDLDETGSSKPPHSTSGPASPKNMAEGHPPAIDQPLHEETSSDEKEQQGKPGSPSSLHVNSDDDDEIRIAKQMALALQQNPDLAPDQVRSMVLKNEAQSKLSSSHSSSAMKHAVKQVKSSVKSSVKSAAKQTGKTVSKATTKATGAVSKATTKATGAVTKATNKVTKATAKAIGHSSKSKEKHQHSPASARSIVDASGAESLNTMDNATRISGRTSSHGNLGPVGNVPSSVNHEHVGPTNQHRISTRVSDPMRIDGAPPIRLTGIVWKRRSGLGKYSTHMAWERRRIVLRGTRLYYYRTGSDAADDESEIRMQQANNGAIHEEDPHFDYLASSPLVTKKTTWLQQATANVTSLAASVSGTEHATSEDSDAARGYLDLVKEAASVGASFGHSSAPTPFALSIKVLSQTKWKFCFDTQSELMQFLAAMTDVVVQGSVDSYNSQIVKSAATDPTLASAGQLSEPPLTGSNKGGPSSSGGHRLWMTGPYTIKTHDALDELAEEMREVVIDSDAEDAKSEIFSVGTEEVQDSGEFPTDQLLTDDWWNIPQEYLFYAGVLVNMAMILSRASSTSAQSFWFLLTFTNFAMFSLLSKDTSKEITVVSSTSSNARVMVRRTSLVTTSNGATRKATMKKKTPIAKRKASIGSTTVTDKEEEGVYLPVAGTTSMKIKEAEDLPVNKDGVVFEAWKIAPYDSIPIRSHGYLTTKKKIPSPGELFKCAQVDMFESERRFPDMAGRVILPKVDYKDDGKPKTWNVPDVFVVSIAIPTSPPKLRGGSDDGGGYTVTAYFTMLQETYDILRRITADGYDPSKENYDDIQKSKVNAVRLLEEWCRRAPSDDSWMARFKVVPRALNLKEIGMPSWIANYNGKPFLIKRPGQTGFLYRHPNKSCMEFDISLHPFPYLAKQGICFMKDTYFKKVLVRFGFVIEGRSDDELPECFIGLVQLCYPNPTYVIQAPDFFAGRSPKSFEPS